MRCFSEYLKEVVLKFQGRLFRFVAFKLLFIKFHWLLINKDPTGPKLERMCRKLFFPKYQMQIQFLFGRSYVIKLLKRLNMSLFTANNDYFTSCSKRKRRFSQQQTYLRIIRLRWQFCLPPIVTYLTLARA